MAMRKCVFEPVCFAKTMMISKSKSNGFIDWEVKMKKGHRFAVIVLLMLAKPYGDCSGSCVVELFDDLVVGVVMVGMMRL
ncbi:hypothetical protein HanRHA438_Chr00c11g0848471 [Helianthus annuus]|nr:hypothetical protein HanIR_Chr07g0325621 [Helianthus annuus]KAJ0954628.1 hypothetical protein HanRHA438_Chr00c11g0848471 [Helianthus annuus]